MSKTNEKCDVDYRYERRHTSIQLTENMRKTLIIIIIFFLKKKKKMKKKKREREREIN
jgi:hypothetical protein